MSPTSKISIGALLCLGMSTLCHAENPAGTLQKAAANGTIVVGYRPASVPFSMRSGSAPPTGYTLDLCAHIIDNIRKELAPDLKVSYVEVKSSDRIQKLLDGEIDLECGSTTNTRERAEQVTFANTTFVTSSRILTHASSTIKSVAGLKGHRVAIAQGASVAPLLSKIDVEQGLNIHYVRVKDFSDGFQALDSGKVDAFVSDDIQFAQYIAHSTHPKDYAIVGAPLSIDALGIMMRKQDVQLHSIANRTLSALVASGEFNKIYAKWFITPSLQFPMSEALKKLLKNPSNQAD